MAIKQSPVDGPTRGPMAQMRISLFALYGIGFWGRGPQICSHRRWLSPTHEVSRPRAVAALRRGYYSRYMYYTHIRLCVKASLTANRP